MGEHDALRAEFWEFSLDVYARSGVAQACLSLQDRHGCDVNVLLLCLWLAKSRHLVLGGPEVRSVQRCAAAPADRLVRPVRSVRRWFKQWSGDALDHDPHASTYAALKEAELHGERLVQAQLIAGLHLCALGSASSAETAALTSFDNYRATLAEPAATVSELKGLAARALH